MSLAIGLTRHEVTFPPDGIAGFCRRWRIRELAVFGSFLRDDFNADSDLDFLYVFAPDASWGLESLDAMEHDLSTIVGRSVDLVSRASVERSTNPIRMRNTLESSERVYQEAIR
jgi:predicted nucleotidyltransferase